MGNVLDKAIVFAVQNHGDAKRKGTKIPYILHPLEAAAIVATMTDDEGIIAGAVLHDVIEDTPVTGADIAREFGEAIAGYVLSESESKREHLPAEDTWRLRKEETIDRLRNGNPPAKMIALGDKLSNVRAIHRDYLQLGDMLWTRFNQKDPEQQGWYYSTLIDCFVELKEFPAYTEYVRLVHEVFG